MSTESLLTRLEAVQPVISRRATYYEGRNPLRFMIDKVDRSVIGFSSNLAKVAVNAVAERIRLEGVEARVKSRDVSKAAWKALKDADFPMLLQSVVTEMLAMGSAYLIVWIDDYSRVVVTGESAEQVAVERDGVTRAVKAAVKRWQVLDANGVVLEEHVMKYEPTQITHLKRDGNHGKLQFVEKIDNPLGVVPVVPLVNVERINDDVGASVIDALAPLLDSLNKLIADMMTTSEAVARPKRWATGVNLEDKEEPFLADGFTADPLPDKALPLQDDDKGVQSPFKDSDDLWIAEAPESRFGQLPGADLGNYESAVNIITRQISAVSSLPQHMLGVATSNPATAESLRVSEMSLARNAEGRIRVINAPIEWAVRLMIAIDEGVTPDEVTVRLKWADTATRAIAQEADAAVKLTGARIIDSSEARELVGRFNQGE